jgi:lysophospholipase L1-like esterase
MNDVVFAQRNEFMKLNSKALLISALAVTISAAFLTGCATGAAGGKALWNGATVVPEGTSTPIPTVVASTQPAARRNPAIVPVQTGVRTTARHNGFVNTAKTGDFDILFEGDSITDWWQQGGQGGTAVQKKNFEGVKIANFAVAGDTTQGVLWGLQNGEGQGHKPKAVMLMIGTNNASGNNTAPEIAEGVGAIVVELRKDFPDAKILLLAIFPRGAGPTDRIRLKNDEINKIIANLDDGQHVFFKNINDKFMTPEGRLIGFRNDNLHPNAEGYEIWAQAVAETLKSWIK